MRLTKTVVALVFAAEVSGCGGGGSGNSASTAGNSNQSSGALVPIAISTYATTAALDPSVPQSVSAMISTVVTTSDTGSLGASLQAIAPAANAESIVLALDATGNIVLASASNAQASSTLLSADSTALALSYLGIGWAPSGASAAAMEGAIRSAADYTALVSAISSSLSSSTSPSTAPAVQALELKVISEASAQIASVQRSNRKNAQTIALPGLSGGAPFTALGGAGLTVSVTGAAAGSIQLQNNMPIYWAAQTQTSSSSPIPNSQADPDGFALLGSHGLASSGVCALTGYICNSTSVPDNGGAAFNLVLKQTPKSIGVNVTSIVDQLVGTALAGVPPDRGPCVQQITLAIIPTATVANFVAENSSSTAFFEALRGYFLGSSFLPALGTVLRDCVTGSVKSEVLAKVMGALTRNVVGLQTANLIYSATGTAATASYLAYYYSTNTNPYLVGVCEGGTSLDAMAYTITNCAAGYTIGGTTGFVIKPAAQSAPSTLSMAVGAVAAAGTDLTLSAYDAQGASTLVPTAGLTFKVSNGNVSIDTAQNVTANSLGNASITVTDAATGAQGVLNVLVTTPVIFIPLPQAAPGTTFNVGLADGNGNPILLPSGSNLQWNSSDASVASITNGVPATVGFGTVHSLSFGLTTISATDSAGKINTLEPANFTVLPSAFSGTYSVTGSYDSGPPNEKYTDFSDTGTFAGGAPYLNGVFMSMGIVSSRYGVGPQSGTNPDGGWAGISDFEVGYKSSLGYSAYFGTQSYVEFECGPIVWQTGPMAGVPGTSSTGTGNAGLYWATSDADPDSYVGPSVDAGGTCTVEVH